MTRCTSKYLVAVIFVGLVGGRAIADETGARTAAFSIEGPILWGSAGLGFGVSSVFGIEGGYMTFKDESHTYDTYSHLEHKSSAYVGPFVEKLWNHKRFGFSLRGGGGAWHEDINEQFMGNSQPYYNLNTATWYPAISGAESAYFRITSRIDLGVGIREILTVNQLIFTPFARLGYSF